ncbi:hypothetical protein HPB51_004216 [Rhipicephalus microplus]|uniref:Uncharacterized protein n=1 Tax=Rhipicephalus microplus TaxID=6941 RepID=A0A9J6DZY4_RHIMP|nr:hypothetical protein HPB51_004216 [Rhipicephalus microplus]
MVTIKQSGNQPAKDIKNVVFYKIKPYLPTKLQATAVKVLLEDACTFYMPNSSDDINGSLVPHLTPMSFHGKLPYMQYNEEIKKYERLNDSGETLINKAEMGTPVVSVGPLGRDGVAIDYAIVLIKVMIEFTSMGRIGKLYHALNDIKGDLQQGRQVVVRPYLLPTTGIAHGAPKRFMHRSGRNLQQYVDKSEWADYKARIDTGEVKLKDVRAINRSKYVEAISCSARSLEDRNAWDPRDETTCLYENPKLSRCSVD